VHHEQSLAAFFKRNKRERYREILSTPRLRHKFTDALAHFDDFDPKFRLPFRSDKLFTDNIACELQKRHSPQTIHVISEDPSIDGKDMLLVEALRQVVGRGMGTVLSCLPGRLIFVETEDERFILERQDLLAKQEYIRFVIGNKDEDSNVERGIFQAAYLAIEWNEVAANDVRELTKLLTWFDGNLSKPSAFGRDALRRGICWFKTEANEHISKVWKIVEILERNGIYVQKIRTDRPGYIIYEDEWQLVAEPFRKGTLRNK
jgi:hypothetical protein